MRLMSDFEMLSLVLMVFMVVVPLVVELIKNTKKQPPLAKGLRLLFASKSLTWASRKFRFYGT